MTIVINKKTYEAGELIAYVKRLEKENAELKEHIKADCIDCADYIKNQNLEKENAELKEINEGYNRNRDKLIVMGFPTFKSCKEYSGKLTNLQKENAELKEKCNSLQELVTYYLQELVTYYQTNFCQEQFIKETEK